jgi:hypothetical protein
MADITITNDSKSTVTITNDSKPVGTTTPTWADMDLKWYEATGTWDIPGTPLVKDSKPTITITNDSKP